MSNLQKVYDELLDLVAVAGVHHHLREVGEHGHLDNRAVQTRTCTMYNVRE